MKRFAIAGAVMFALAPPAPAQQQPLDPQVAVYRQLLDNANAQLAQSIAAKLQSELAAEKARNAPSPAPAPSPNPAK